MSVPFQSGMTSRVTGQVNFNWISEAWRFFSAQMGVWIVATLVFSAPVFIFVIVLYAMILSTMFPAGFTAPPVQTVPPPGSNPFQVIGINHGGTNGFASWIFLVEIGFAVVYSFWSAYLYGGMFRMAVKQVRGLPIEMRDIFRGGPLFGRMLGAIWLLGLGAYGLEAVCLGPVALLSWRHGPAAALVVAGIVGVLLVIVLTLALTGMLLPAFALMADGNGVITSIKRSFRMMKNCWLTAAGFVFVVGLLVYVSELFCGLGLLATVPMVFLITALAYRDMLGMPNMVAPFMPGYSPAGEGVWPPAPTASQVIPPQERTDI